MANCLLSQVKGICREIAARAARQYSSPQGGEADGIMSRAIKCLAQIESKTIKILCLSKSQTIQSGGGVSTVAPKRCRIRWRHID